MQVWGMEPVVSDRLSLLGAVCGFPAISCSERDNMHVSELRHSSYPRVSSIPQVVAALAFECQQQWGRLNSSWRRLWLPV